MTVREMIELVYFNVTGGKPSDDVEVKLADIRAMLPAVINYVLTGGVWEDRKSFYESLKILGYAQDETQELTQAVTLSVTADSVSALYYATLPYGIQHLPGGRGLKNAYSKDRDTTFVKAQSLAEVQDLDFPVYWGYEGGSNHRLWFKNLGSECDVVVELIYSSSTLADGDEVPLPAGKEYHAMRLLGDWFSIQRGHKRDYITNAYDEYERKPEYPNRQGGQGYSSVN